jgi:hypothetical protein
MYQCMRTHPTHLCACTTPSAAVLIGSSVDAHSATHNSQICNPTVTIIIITGYHCYTTYTLAKMSCSFAFVWKDLKDETHVRRSRHVKWSIYFRIPHDT